MLSNRKNTMVQKIRIQICQICFSFVFLISILNAQDSKEPTPQLLEQERFIETSQFLNKQVMVELDTLRRKLKKASPPEAAALLRAFISKYGINVNEIKDLPREVDPQKVEVNKTLFDSPRGLENELENKLRNAKVEGKLDEQVVIVIQFARNISLGERLSLLDRNFKIYDEKALTTIARVPVRVIQEVVSEPFVRWMGEFKPEYKYDISKEISLKKFVFIYPLDEDTPEHREDLRRLGIRIEKYYEKENIYVVETSDDNFSRIAQLWWVRWIEREPMENLHAVYFEPDDSREFISAFKTSFSGNGVRIGVYDTGIWNGNNIDFPAGSIFTLSNFGDANGHGTHVSGIIAARGRETTYRGVAFGASIYMVPGIGGIFTYQDAFNYFSNNNVWASNHSWGYDNSYTYDQNTTNIDGYADDGRIVVFSAGNDGPSSQTITNPGLGKNVVTVGSIQYLKDATYGRVIGDVANYSSRGPVRNDARLKPDIVAPGGQTNADYGFYRNGVVSTRNSSGTPDNNTWPDNVWYTRMSGTSMAAPHVTGIAAKSLQWDPNLRSHTFKAGLINNAIQIKANTNSPLSGYANTNVGYGLANAFSITNYYAGEEQTLLYISDDVNSLTNSEDNHIVNVPSGAKRFAGQIVNPS